MNTPFLIGSLFAIFSVWMLAHAVKNHRKALHSKNWPSVMGEISVMELWGTRNIDGQMQPAEKLKVEYLYEVQGKSYKSRTAAFYTLMYPETLNFARQYPVNTEVSVYYDIKNPSESVLITGPRSGNKKHSDIILAGTGLVVSISVAVFGALGKIG